MHSSNAPFVHRGEFALSLPRLTAGTWAHVCPRCPRKSARAFYCTACECRSVTAEQARAFAGQVAL